MHAGSLRESTPSPEEHRAGSFGSRNWATGYLAWSSWKKQRWYLRDGQADISEDGVALKPIVGLATAATAFGIPPSVSVLCGDSRVARVHRVCVCPSALSPRAVCVVWNFLKFCQIQDVERRWCALWCSPMKRGADDDGQFATMTVHGRYLRTGHASLPAEYAASWVRKAAPKHEALDIQEYGFAAASEWATARVNSGRMQPQAVRDRALLMVSDMQCQELLDGAASLKLRTPLPDAIQPGSLAENIFVKGNATARTLCVGDVLEVVSTKRRRDAAKEGRRELRLQVSSPCQPCSKVDQRLGQTWDGRGVRAHAARTGSRGWFVRVLSPGTLRDGDTLAVVERPNPTWPLARVADLLYNMDGVCDAPGRYRWPSSAEEVAAKWRGTPVELRELATLPELAGFEWRDEAANMLAAKDAAGVRTKCAIM